MGKEISLFSGYSQEENRTTNYCLLVLRMLYEEDPKLLGEVLSTLVGKNIVDHIGVKFYQQVKKKSSVPDGLIIQRSFTLYIETKNDDSFDRTQLENHLDALKEIEGTKVLIALGNFDSSRPDWFENIQRICQKKYKGSIYFVSVSFDDLIQSLEALEHVTKNLSDIISDFRNYLDECGLLPSWKRWLDVVNCAVLPEEVQEGNVYMCPTTGRAYNHKRCQFFGMYRNERVERIAVIEAVVDLISEEEPELKWKNVETCNTDLIAIAKEKRRNWRPDDYPVRVFVLGDFYQTDFIKDTGGNMRIKQYFDIGSLEPEGPEDLAEKLRNKVWSCYTG